MNKFHEMMVDKRAKAAYRDKSPTLTDQSQAAETDINVIVKRYGVHGQAPGTTREPMYGDFTGLPTDLRGFIETGRALEEHRERLPEKLRDMPITELLALTPEELTNILTPPAPPPGEGETK